METKEQVYQDKDTKDDYESPFEVSIGSSSSSSSSNFNLMEDETSSSHGPLYELSELMAQLPIKRGLSKYYQGKSKTFTSLSSVNSLEDLAKRGRPSRRKSYGGGFGNRIHSPNPIISKKTNFKISLFSTPETNGERTVLNRFGIL